MATYTNHSQHTHADPAEDQGPVRESNAPMLMAALALALVALGVWWYAQRDGTGVATTTPPMVTVIEPPPAATAATTESRPTPAPRTRSERTRTPAIADRAPRPLAGNPAPEYPRNALRAGEEGAVTLRIAVDARGMPTDVQVVDRSGTRDRGFDRAAIDAARQWRFAPAIRDGKAVPATVQLPVEFRRG